MSAPARAFLKRCGSTMLHRSTRGRNTRSCHHGAQRSTPNATVRIGRTVLFGRLHAPRRTVDRSFRLLAQMCSQCNVDNACFGLSWNRSSGGRPLVAGSRRLYLTANWRRPASPLAPHCGNSNCNCAQRKGGRWPVGVALFDALAKQLRSCVRKVRAFKRLNKNAMSPK
jgi:hypothetical protein